MPFVRRALLLLVVLVLAAATVPAAFAQSPTEGGEVDIKIPDLTTVTFAGGVNGHSLLSVGLVISGLGFVFGLIIYSRLKNMPVHASMKEISELIYETCKTYLLTQGRFLL